MRTQIYLGYNLLPLHKRFVLVDQSSLSHKGIIDLRFTCNKNTIYALECCYKE